jgi:hypothetical protein
MRIATNQAALVDSLVDATGFSRVREFNQFGKEAELYNDHPEAGKRYMVLKPLDELLVKNLSSLREYVVGCMSVFYLYSFGETSEGDWVGVRTTAIWT